MKKKFKFSLRRHAMDDLEYAYYCQGLFYGVLAGWFSMGFLLGGITGLITASVFAFVAGIMWASKPFHSKIRQRERYL